MWDGIRTFADLMHLLSFIIILYKLITQRNAKGVSLKTQEIYLIVFCSRYLDLLMYYVNLYNTTMKVCFITATLLIIYLMRFKKPICDVRSTVINNFIYLIYRLIIETMTIYLIII